MYDIYLFSGCDVAPDMDVLQDLLQGVDLADVVDRVTLRYPGFLGLSLEKEIAIQLLKAVMVCFAEGIYLPKEYEVPVITEEYAANVGNVELQRVKYEYPNLHFLPPSVISRHVLWYDVIITCSEWQEDDDLIPGAIILYVDKIDGHIWRKEDLDSFFFDQPVKRM
ncbi:MAG: hypothetical protein OHK0022_19380 [Roseiflexaceae bacterium]